MNSLPRVVIAGRLFFQDDRLQEFRPVHDPYSPMKYSLIDPSSDMVHQEPSRDDDEPYDVATLRQSMDEAAFAIQNFGIQLWQKFGAAPEFEDDASNISSSKEKALHDRFFALQAAYVAARSALVDAIAEHHRVQEPIHS